MARAVRLQVNPADRSDYYVAWNTGLLDSRGIATEVTSPFTADALDGFLVGFQVTDWVGARGGYACSSYGRVYSFGGSTTTGQASALYGTSNQARDMIANPASNGQVAVLSMRGAVRGVGPSMTDVISDQIFTSDLARRLFVTPGSWPGIEGYILDAYGGLHPFGGAPALTVADDYDYQAGVDFFRAFSLNPADPDHGYAMQGSGILNRIHEDTLPMVDTGGQWFGDVATDFVVTDWSNPVFILQLDQEGGVRTMRTSSPPTVTITSPVDGATIEDNVHPLITYDYDDPDGDAQGSTRCWIYTKAQTLAPGFQVGADFSIQPHVWNSGPVVSSTRRSFVVGVPVDARRWDVVEEGTRATVNLPEGRWVTFVYVRDRYNQGSGFSDPVEFTTVFDPGAKPVVEVTPLPDEGAAKVRVTVPDNLLSKQAADFEDAAAAVGWTADANMGTPARSTAFAYRKSASLRFTATADGDARARLTTNVDAGPDMPITGMARLRSDGNPRRTRMLLREYDTAGSLITTQVSPEVDQGGGGGEVEPDPVPVADFSISDTTPNEGDTVTLNAGNTFNLDENQGQTISIAWTQLLGSPVVLIPDATYGVIAVRFAAPSPPQTMRFGLTATNEFGQTDVQEQDITSQPRSSFGQPVAVIEASTSDPVPGEKVTLNGVSASVAFSAVRGSAPLVTPRWSQPAGQSESLVVTGYGPGVVDWTPTALGIRTFFLDWVAADGQVSDRASLPITVRPETTGGTGLAGVTDLRLAIGDSHYENKTVAELALGRRFAVRLAYGGGAGYATAATNVANGYGDAGSDVGNGRRLQKVIDVDITPTAQTNRDALRVVATTTTHDAGLRNICRVIASQTQEKLDNSYVCFGRESNGSHYSWGSYTSNVFDPVRAGWFRAAYRKCVNMLREECVLAGKARPPRTVWNVALFPVANDAGRNGILQTYPGDSYVDVMTQNWYTWYAGGTWQVLRDHLRWWEDVTKGTPGFRWNETAGAATGSGQPKLFGSCEFSMRMHWFTTAGNRNSQDQIVNLPTGGDMGTSYAWYGDGVDIHKQWFDMGRRLIAREAAGTGPGLAFLIMFDKSIRPQQYQSVLRPSGLRYPGGPTTVPADFTQDAVAVARAGEMFGGRCQNGSPGVRNYRGFDGIMRPSAMATAAGYICGPQSAGGVGGPMP